MTVPTPVVLAPATAVDPVSAAPVFGSYAVAPCVCPEIRLRAPGVEGPNVVSHMLSLIA